MGRTGKAILIETNTRAANLETTGRLEITNEVIISYASEQWLAGRSILSLIRFRIVGTWRYSKAE